jgi:SAM-dependent methyltransferase
VAESSDRLYRTTTERFQVIRCCNCGMCRLSPQPDPAALASYYPAHYWFDADESSVTRLADAYRRVVLRDHVRFVVRAYNAAGGAGRMLDAGCGGGLLLGMLRKRGVPGIGLDSSAEACAIAWRSHKVPAVTGDLASNPFAPGTFPLVTLFHVLEHVSDPRGYLAAIRPLLQPGGRLVVQVPNAACWQFGLLGRRWNGLDVPRHLNDFRAQDIEFVLQSSGFDVVRAKHFSLRDNPAGLATSLAPGLDPVARRVRGVPTGFLHFAAYFSLVLASLPLAAMEAAFGHGSTIMLEARPR